MPQRCTATTARGAPCRGWAQSGTDPPRCSAHAEQTAPAHASFYAASLKPDELADLFTYADLFTHADDLTLDDEIACARVVLRCFAIPYNKRRGQASPASPSSTRSLAESATHPSPQGAARDA